MQQPAIWELFEELHAAKERTSQTRASFGGAPIFVYGAGNDGKDVFELLSTQGLSVVGLLDRQAKQGSEWEGVPVRRADDDSISASERAAAHVVMGIFSPYVDMPPVHKMLADLGFGRVTTYLDLHACFAREIGDRYWLTCHTFYEALKPLIAAGYDLWSDETSRTLYTQLLKFRFTSDYEALPRPELSTQYFPTDIPAWRSPLRFVDCGAYDGDTLAALISRNLAVEAIAAFEPDPANFVKLSRYVGEHRSAMPEVACLFPCGVDSSTKQISFHSGLGEGSHPSNGGNSLVQCVSLDQALPGFKPNLIKMDIEGAEFGALWGARRIIEEERPALAVCVYHRPGHLWQIPLLVQRLSGGGGRFYLRMHGFNSFDVVFYWVPD